MDKEIFVQNVKRYCEIKKIKPTNACKESGVGGSFLSDINRGQVPSVAKVQLLAQYLGVTVSELLGEMPGQEEKSKGALTDLLARSAKAQLTNDSPPHLSQTALQVAKAYDQAGPGIQESVRKLLDVEVIPQEYGHAKEAM